MVYMEHVPYVAIKLAADINAYRWQTTLTADTYFVFVISNVKL